MIYSRLGRVGGIGTIDEDGTVANPDAGIGLNGVRIWGPEIEHRIHEHGAHTDGKCHVLRAQSLRIDIENALGLSPKVEPLDLGSHSDTPPGSGDIPLTELVA